jgi:PAS domain S-box-containing protein
MRRLSVRAKEAWGVAVLTFLVVAVTTLIHLSQLTGVLLQDVLKQAEFIGKQIFDQCRHSLLQGQGGNPQEILKSDQNLQRFLEASVGYSPHLLYALIADIEGKTILHTEIEKGDLEVTLRPRIEDLLSVGPIQRFYVLLKGGTIYESTLPMTLNDEPFGSVKLGIHTSLLRGQLSTSLNNSLTFAAIALPVAWLITLGLATLTLKPIHALARQMEQLRQGDFDVLTDLSRTDEFRELASQVQLLGQQLQSDRFKQPSEKSPLQSVVDHLGDGVLLLSQSRRILYGNKAIEDIMGRPLEQVEGCLLENVVEASHPLRAVIEEVFEQQVSVRNAVLLLPVDGTSKEFQVSVVCLREEQKVMGAVALFKNLESSKTLTSLISYSAKLTAVGQLTSGLAHEVKNPLNSMTIHLELLKEQLGVSSPEVTHSLDVIEGEIRRLDRVVQGFLKFMRPEELHLTPVEVNTLLKNEGTLLEAEWNRKGICFVYRLDPNLPSITADEELLRQVFLNIVLNACQAMAEGGTVTLATERGQGELITVSITDQGCGIAPEERDKIFKLYYTTKSGGSGLGLALVYRIVQLHNGTVEVISELGRGTSMIIRLPVKP